MPILGMLGGVEVGNGDEDLGQFGVFVLAGPYAPLLEPEGLGVDEDLLPEYFIELFGWGLGLRARLVLVVVFGVGRGLGKFEALVGIVKLLLLVVLLAVEVWGALLGIFARGGLVQFDFGRCILLERHPAAQAGVDGGDLRGVLR